VVLPLLAQYLLENQTQSGSSDYYLKTEIDTQGEVETIWGVDLANNGDLHSAVTFVSGSHNYLSLLDQQITLNQIEIGTSTDLSAGTGLTLSGYTLNLDNDFGADINVTELASENFGDFTCNGTACSLNTNYLPLAGGTITGTLTVEGILILQQNMLAWEQLLLEQSCIYWLQPNNCD